ncbi:MAG: hypothetical protein M1825_000202 [Sarcosagium campestre]|nr:MAG: hypothetical protein M1825_000202 [Sarcosagium campestre]
MDFVLMAKSFSAFSLVDALRRIQFEHGPVSESNQIKTHRWSALIQLKALAPPSPHHHLRVAARTRNTIPLLRYLFPHARQRARSRLFDFRHETIPYYRQRVQSRIYGYLVDRRARTNQKRAAGGGILALLRRGQRTLRNKNNDAPPKRHSMTQPPSSISPASTGEYGPESRERGARRRKLAGYLKAANELRQSYQEHYVGGRSDPAADEDEQGIPGAFPDVSIVRSGYEEMVLFPSYARRHVKKWANKQEFDDYCQRASRGQTGRQPAQENDADYWRRQWEKNEDDNAIVDVDVRGWLYSPHRGQMTRKNRMLIGLARHLSGVPAPAQNTAGSQASDARLGQPSTHHERAQEREARREEELVSLRAESILKKGEGEANVAERGGYSEDPNKGYESRSSTPDSEPREPLTPQHLRRRKSDGSNSSTMSSLTPASIANRASWNQPADMTPAEQSVANAHLMARLKPFLTNPLANTPITVFFYDENTSQSRAIMTNEAGHFTMRAALDFVPTDVRVLASESLSATEEVRIVEPNGVSLISDIDDTIKHSAVGSGAKEIFRNTFIRELGDLTIEGVKEWYSRMSDMGVTLHYVSNSPWQLYPVLVSYFTLAGLPPGSFHLKQYSGMLQGIFEPVAERKKGTLEKIMSDFPERKFLLVGDSGEADLEVYTDVVLANPGRIVGVFIRDITTPQGQGFFDSSITSLDRRPPPARADKHASGEEDERLDDSFEADAPPLPKRPSPQTAGKPSMGKLIDFDNDDDNGEQTSVPPRTLTDSPSPIQSPQPTTPRRKPDGKSPAPTRPAKPSALRSSTSTSTVVETPEYPNDQKKPNPAASTPQKPAAPPLPPKPRAYSNSQASTDSPDQPQPKPKPPAAAAAAKAAPTTSRQAYSYAPNVRERMTNAYNMLPSTSSILGSARTTAADPASSTRGSNEPTPDESNSSKSHQSRAPPPAPPSSTRRALTSYPSAAAQYASTRLGVSGSNWSGNAAGSAAAGADENSGVGGGSSGETTTTTAGPGPVVNKKEELWKRRWARAKDLLEPKGVVLRSWRVGDDVMNEAVRLVQKVNKDMDSARDRDRDQRPVSGR